MEMMMICVIAICVTSGASRVFGYSSIAAAILGE